jgi:hypothetical protein
MFTMILIVTYYANAISVSTISFNSEANCLQAIAKSLDMEDKHKTIGIKARCVKQ